MYQKTHSISSLTVEVRIKWRYNGLDMFICWYVLCHNFCNLLYMNRWRTSRVPSYLHFKTPPGPAVKMQLFGLPAGNRPRDPATPRPRDPATPRPRDPATPRPRESIALDFSFICHTVSEYILNRHSHRINTELVAMLLARASVARLAEHRARFAGSRVRFPAGSPKSCIFATGPGGVLK